MVIKYNKQWILNIAHCIQRKGPAHVLVHFKPQMHSDREDREKVDGWMDSWIARKDGQKNEHVDSTKHHLQRKQDT